MKRLLFLFLLLPLAAEAANTSFQDATNIVRAIAISNKFAGPAFGTNLALNGLKFIAAAGTTNGLITSAGGDLDFSHVTGVFMFSGATDDGHGHVQGGDFTAHDSGGFVADTGPFRGTSFIGGTFTGDGSGLTNLPASGGLFSGALTNGLLQPFDPTKTYLVFIGDSITAEGLVTPFTDYVTNFPAWAGLKFYTNQAVGGQALLEQTNIFYTTTLPMLPAITGGTNVIVSISLGGNDLTRGTNVTYLINEYSNFFSDLNARGFKVVCSTILPRDYFTSGSFAFFNNWLSKATNLVFAVPDFAYALNNPSNTVWFSDGTHPTASGQYEMAKAWDQSVRLATKGRSQEQQILYTHSPST